jgi:hypothetical protein
MKAESARSYSPEHDQLGEYGHLVSSEVGEAPDHPRTL